MISICSDKVTVLLKGYRRAVDVEISYHKHFLLLCACLAKGCKVVLNDEGSLFICWGCTVSLKRSS